MDIMKIDSAQISYYVQELEYTNKKLQEAVDKFEKEREMFDIRKFYGTSISCEACAKMHGVCVATVWHYIRAGLIPKHPDSIDKRILIRTSDAIALNFETLRKRKK